MTEAIISLGRRLLMLRFSMVTGWEQTARLMAFWRARADCSFLLASQIPSTTLMWRAT